MRLLKNIQYAGDCPDKQCMDIYLPDATEFKTILYFHGGGLESGDKNDCANFLKPLVNKGFAAITSNYRMYPDAKYPDFIDDVACAVSKSIETVKQYGDCSEFFIGGSSAGAYLAAMLCFDKRYLTKHKIDPDTIAGYIFDAPQPTTHFNVLREKGIDQRRIIVDEAAPLFHVFDNRNYPKMLFISSENDIPNRLQQINLTCEVLKNFGYRDKTHFICMEGYDHCGYCDARNESGQYIFSYILEEFMCR